MQKLFVDVKLELADYVSRPSLDYTIPFGLLPTDIIPVKNIFSQLKKQSKLKKLNIFVFLIV